jgi:hypothetical protein
LDGACVLADGLPVALFHAGIGKDPDERVVLDIVFDLV